MRHHKLLLIFALFIAIKTSAQEVILEPDSILKKRVVKMEFFSPLTGNLTIGYEQYLKDFTSIEGKIGIIGLGTQHGYNATGAFIKVGPKFKLKPSYATRGTFGTHLLRGSYIRPEIAVSVFQWEDTDEFDNFGSQSNNRKNINSVAILINYGKQFVLGKVMTLDWHVGIGYGFSNHDEHGYYHGFVAANNDFPMAFSTGLTLGFLLK